MQRLDSVRIKNDTEQLKQKNIYKGYFGFLVDYIEVTGEWTVCVFDEYNLGIYAVVRIAEKDLEPDRLSMKYLMEDAQTIIDKPDFYTHTTLYPAKFKEYDKVMLMVDKPKYAKAGLKRGDIGCVMFPYAILNDWGVTFTVKDLVEDIHMEVNQDDMEVID